MKIRNNSLNLILFIIVFFSISCSQKSQSSKEFENNPIEANNIILLTIEQQIQNGSLELVGKEFSPVFIKDVWKSNLPENSSLAIQDGYDLINRLESSSEDDMWTYLEGYGYSQEVLVSNSQTKILYWENSVESKIWSFTSTSDAIVINGIKPIGRNLVEIVEMYSLPSSIKDNIIEYDNKDFILRLYFIDSICIKIEFENSI